MKKAAVLVSYFYVMKEPSLAELFSHPKVDVMLDSGGFSAKSLGKEIDLETYCDFLDQQKNRLFAYLALDKVGDPVVTEEYLLRMIDRGLNPMPIHVLGDGKEKMDELFGLTDYVALAGLRRPGKLHCSKSYLKQKMEWAGNRKVHWLGYVRSRDIAAYKPYSVDSSSFTTGGRWGFLYLYKGGGRWVKAKQHKRFKFYRDPDCMRVLRNEYGIKKHDLEQDKFWKGVHLNPINTNEFLKYMQDMFDSTGTRMFLAFNKSSLPFVMPAIDRMFP